ncbi:methyltransferase domain-containing protein [Roseomonas sp. BN140053]|uniref:methyltransferase domain-containing protein n=1 Tax=Roseomonas sp. BN140053 TaxID=3391898 RepID=UPI0039E8F227
MPSLAAAGQHAPLFAAVAGRYAGGSRFGQGYVRSKLRRDPATSAILELAARRGGFGQVADLGCGRGQLSLALLLAGLAEAVSGLDGDAAKLAEARAAAAGLPARYAAADLTEAPVAACDTVLLVDVLYQLPAVAQRDLLNRAAAAARRRVVIRAFDPQAGWRSRVGMFTELANRALRGDWQAAIEPLPVAALAAPLEAAGFRATVSPCWAGTPLPNVLILAERDAA